MKLNEIKLLNENAFPTNKDEIEKILNELEIKNYRIHPNGVVDVDRNVNLSSKNLYKIPIQFGKVTGNFDCYDNKLTSLVGCPTAVMAHFDCSNNRLTNLAGCPTSVGVGAGLGFSSGFYCNDNQLTTLEGINDLISRTNGPFAYISRINTKIQTGGLGLILIDGISRISISFADQSVEKIIEKYLGRPNDIFECQNELIEAGLEEYAKL